MKQSSLCQAAPRWVGELPFLTTHFSSRQRCSGALRGTRRFPGQWSPLSQWAPARSPLQRLCREPGPLLGAAGGSEDGAWGGLDLDSVLRCPCCGDWDKPLFLPGSHSVFSSGKAVLRDSVTTRLCTHVPEPGCPALSFITG